MAELKSTIVKGKLKATETVEAPTLKEDGTALSDKYLDKAKITVDGTTLTIDLD